MSSATVVLFFIFAFFSLPSTPSAQAAGSNRPFAAQQQTRNGGGSYLGIGLVDIDSERAKALNLDSERGAEIMKVQEGSPADKAGLKPGDALLTYNGEAILGAQQLGRLVWETPEGRHVKIQFWRDGKMQTTTVVTGAPPSPSFDMNQDMGRLTKQLDHLRYSMVTDIPNPLLVWKNRTLGVESEPVDSQLADYFGVHNGILLRSVDKGSAADKAGLRSGDVLTAIDNHPLMAPRDLSQYLRNRGESANTAVQVSLMRDHKRMTVNVTPSASPE